MITNENRVAVQDWILNGCPAPAPHAVKMALILTLTQSAPRTMFVETGTYEGVTTRFMAEKFAQVKTIEVAELYFNRAQKSLSRFPNVEQFLGDSADVLKTLVPTLTEPAVFWLDGHFSGGETGQGRRDTPLIEELVAIYNAPVKHHVLIDDIRLCGTGGYPRREFLQEFIALISPYPVQFTERHDILAIGPA